MTISKSPYASSRFKMYLIGFDLALQSMAHTPTTSIAIRMTENKYSLGQMGAREWMCNKRLPIEMLNYIFLDSEWVKVELGTLVN